MAPRSTSMAPSDSPSSRWSLGSKPSAPKSRIVPCVSRTTKSSSPPTGTSGWTRLPSWRRSFLASSSASCCSASAALTSAASWPVFLSSSAFSSAEALEMSLPMLFCSERSSSKRTPDDLRRSSADRRASTSATSSPRARCEARTRSGSSRSRRRSITLQGYRCRVGAHDSVFPYTPRVAICPKCLSVRGASRGVKERRPDSLKGSGGSAWLTRIPCGEGDLEVGSSTVIHTPEKLSTGCAKDLWITEVIVSKGVHEMANSRSKPPSRPLSGGNA